VDLFRRFHELRYKRGTTAADWLANRKVGTSDFNPAKLPYYILLVGGPEAIPFEFQYQLDMEYAVGRLAFEEVDQYRHYAQGVVDYETSAPPNTREVVYWAPCNRSPEGRPDPSTQLSENFLIGPLADGVSDSDDQAALVAPAAAQGFRTLNCRGAGATKAALLEALHPRADGSRPALLVSASHGHALPRGHPSQRTEQGALLCQDWPFGQPVQRGHRLAADDLDNAQLHGLVAFLFACYGAGTPAYDSFPQAERRRIDSTAEPPFVAALTQRLLSHTNGPALAVVGHVERAWGFSIQPPGVGAQVGPFRNLLLEVLKGRPVGHAVQHLNDKFARLSAKLLGILHSQPPTPRPPDAELGRMWIDRNDFQNYVLLGDPAVHLEVDRLK
jgi:hypothetical protein